MRILTEQENFTKPPKINTINILKIFNIECLNFEQTKCVQPWSIEQCKDVWSAMAEQPYFVWTTILLNGFCNRLKMEF